MTKQLFDVQRYVVVSFDEMRIQLNFASDKHSNKLVGFVIIIIIIIINKSLQRIGHFSVQMTLLSKCVLYLPI